MRAAHDSTRVTRVRWSGLWSLGLLVSALAVGACAPPLVGSFEPRGKTPNEIAAHAAHSPEHRAYLVRTILGCHADPGGCSNGTTLSDADAASIRVIVQRTSKMKSAPALRDVPTHLPPMVLSDLLDAGLVKMPQLPSVTAGAFQQQPLDNKAWFEACNLRNGAYEGLGAAPEDFARYQVLLDHGWPVDELDLMFVMRVVPDTPAGLALVDQVYARLGNPSPNQDFTGAAIMRQHPESLLDDHNRRNLSAAGQWVRHWGNPFLGAIGAGKRHIVTQLLARGTVKDVKIDQVAATVGDELPRLVPALLRGEVLAAHALAVELQVLERGRVRKERVVAGNVCRAAQEAENAGVDGRGAITKEIALVAEQPAQGVEVCFSLRDDLALGVAPEPTGVELRAELLQQHAGDDPAQDGGHAGHEFGDALGPTLAEEELVLEGLVIVLLDGALHHERLRLLLGRQMRVYVDTKALGQMLDDDRRIADEGAAVVDPRRLALGPLARIVLDDDFVRDLGHAQPGAQFEREGG